MVSKPSPQINCRSMSQKLKLGFMESNLHCQWHLILQNWITVFWMDLPANFPTGMIYDLRCIYGAALSLLTSVMRVPQLRDSTTPSTSLSSNQLETLTMPRCRFGIFIQWTYTSYMFTQQARPFLSGWVLFLRSFKRTLKLLWGTLDIYQLDHLANRELLNRIGLHV